MYKVLVVDDEYLIRDGLAEAIPWGDVGFEVSGTASNGQEALASIGENVPHVILTDVKMPIMDGIELCQKIKSGYPQIKTVILSGYSEFEYAQKAIEFNVYAYILKPLNEEHLLTLFKNLRHELETQESMDRRDTAAKDSLKMNREELKEYVFMKLLSRNFEDCSCYEEQLSKAGFAARDYFFNLLAFRCATLEQGSGDPVSDAVILQLAREYARPEGYEVLYLDNTFYLIMLSKDRISQRDQRHYANSLKCFLEEKLDGAQAGCSYIVSVGAACTCTGFPGLRQCAGEASTALKHTYYRGEGNIIFFDRSMSDQDKNWNTAEIDTAVEEITAGLLNHNTNSIVFSLRKLFSCLSSVSILDMNKLYVKCIQIYAAITTEIKKEYIFISALTEDEFYNQIAGCRTFGRLTKIFEASVFELDRQMRNYNQTSDKYRFIQKVRKYVEEHYFERLSLDQLASSFFINPTYLSRIFKEETNTNLSEYIQNVRMTHAKRLLNKSDTRVQDISRQVGYEDYRHFCTVFKKATGITPLQYRIKSV